MEAEFQRVQQTLNEVTGSGAAVINSETGSGHIDRSVDKATSTFDRVASSVTGTPAGTTSSDPAKLAELEELSRKNRIKERLERYRKEAS